MTQRKKPEENLSNVWYLVEPTADPKQSLADFCNISDTLQDACLREIENSGKFDNKLYAFKIELMGEVIQKIEIKKS
jgi:hypothetical protein